MDRTELGQLLNLWEDLIPAGKQNRPGVAIQPLFITMHNTSNTNAGADAAAHARFVKNTGFYMLNGKKNWVSWHYTVDDKQVIKHLPADEKAYHAGPANSVSVGIEVCMHQGINQSSANLRAARLVAALLFDLGLGVDKLRTHKSWTNKHCPTLILDHWQEFVHQVSQIRNSITSVALVERPPQLSDEEAALVAVEAGLVYDSEDIDHHALASAMQEMDEVE